MAKHKRHGGRGGFTLPLAVVGGFVPTITGLYERRSNVTEMGNFLKSGWTGLNPDNSFNFMNLKSGLLPAVLGGVVHKIAGRLGINRALGRARIPFIRV